LLKDNSNSMMLVRWLVQQVTAIVSYAWCS
jgi:hypothetical protein